MHHHGERKTKHELERHADQSERHGAQQGSTKTRIVGRLHEVSNADERPAQPWQTEIMDVQRVPPGDRDRDNRDEQDNRERRRNENPRQSCLGTFD
jgi:hypothetical protein